MTYLPRLPAPPPPTGARRWLRAVFELGSRRTRREVAYLAITAVLGTLGFVFVVVLAVLGPLLALTVVGLPLVGAALVAARRAGALQREVVARVFHRNVLPPPRPDRDPGLRAWTRSALTDRAGWRALAYLVLHVPVVVCSFLIGAAGFGAAALVLAPLWRLIRSTDGDGGPWSATLGLAVAGAVALLLLPWVVRAVVAVDVRLVRSHLGATEQDTVVKRSRARTVNRAAVTLRRLEGRPEVDPVAALATPVTLDLRDGVPHGVVVEADGAATESDAGDGGGGASPDPEPAGVDHRGRERGLGQVLARLAGEVPTPTRLHLDLNGTRLPGTVEALAEVAAIELMANVVRHSGAGLAELSAVAGHGSLTLRVSDDGRGGVEVGDGTGLDRLSTLIAPVRGHLMISSPPGGPTDITVALPLAPPEAAPEVAPDADVEADADAETSARTDGPPPRIVRRADALATRSLRGIGRRLPRRPVS